MPGEIRDIGAAAQPRPGLKQQSLEAAEARIARGRHAGKAATNHNQVPACLRRLTGRGRRLARLQADTYRRQTGRPACQSAPPIHPLLLRGAAALLLDGFSGSLNAELYAPQCALLSTGVMGEGLLFLFAIVMMLMGILMLRSRGREGNAGVVLRRDKAPR